tara:strand:- start:469 stop:1503 length:1035 start_codon:yes stop_codon:yes gene_type:complete
MSLKEKNILVTGAAGFIGASLITKLFEEKVNVVGIDNLNNYSSRELKKIRLSKLIEEKEKHNVLWDFHQISLEEKEVIFDTCNKYNFDVIIHLAAQAGVRYSLENPHSYINSNLVGFANILEICREQEIKNFIFASSSSVYGINKKIPFEENDNVDHPISLYASTKKSNEVMAHSYSHLYKIPTTGLRLFTVYGPYGRPDMAPMIFANSIMKSKPINIFNYGKMKRDFTYIDDIVSGIIGCCKKPAQSLELDDFAPSSSICAPYRIFNIGNNNSVELNYFIELIEKNLGLKAIRNYMPIQPGDVTQTYADVSKLNEWIGYKPKTTVEEGVKLFSDWFKKFYDKF